MIREMHHEEQEWYTDQDETFADYKYRVDQEENELDAEDLGGIHDDFEEEEVKPLQQRHQRLAASPRRSGMGRRHESVNRLTKSRLKRIIKEEKSKLIREMWGDDVEVPNDLITFAKAYRSLGDAVASQVDDIVYGWVSGGVNGNNPEFMETVYETNPNAIDLALERLGRLYLDDSADQYGDVIDALEAAKRIFERGDEEVEADARAAGDR